MNLSYLTPSKGVKQRNTLQRWNQDILLVWYYCYNYKPKFINWTCPPFFSPKVRKNGHRRKAASFRTCAAVQDKLRQQRSLVSPRLLQVTTTTTAKTTATARIWRIKRRDVKKWKITNWAKKRRKRWKWPLHKNLQIRLREEPLWLSKIMGKPFPVNLNLASTNYV